MCLRVTIIASSAPPPLPLNKETEGSNHRECQVHIQPLPFASKSSPTPSLPHTVRPNIVFFWVRSDLGLLHSAMKGEIKHVPFCLLIPESDIEATGVV